MTWWLLFTSSSSFFSAPFAGLLFGDDMVAPLHLLLFLLLCNFGGLSGLLLLPQIHTVPSQVPLLERLCIDLDDGVLDEGLRADELVAGGVVDHIEQAHLPCAVLRAPGKVAGVQPESAVLLVPAAAPHSADPLLAQLAERHGPAHLILALLLVDVAPASRLPVLVARVAGDSHLERSGARSAQLPA